MFNYCGSIDYPRCINLHSGRANDIHFFSFFSFSMRNNFFEIKNLLLYKQILRASDKRGY